MTRPNFLIIGAMKAGTTSMHYYIGAHPQVFMPRANDLNFFIEEMNWNRGWGWYEEQFAGAEGAIAIGEVSPGYSFHPVRRGVSERIAAALPQARFVYIVRHPIERMRSQWVHRSLRGMERRSLDQALLDDPRYLDRSRYAMQVEQYLRYFPREQLKLVVTEQLAASQETIMRDVYEFLGVDATWTGDVMERRFNRTDIKERAAIPQVRPRGLPRRTPAGIRRAYDATVGTLVRTLHPPSDPRTAVLSDRVRVELEARVRDDVARLRELMPVSFDGWGIA
jgi:hypothetical protein